jgi:hypothetical protein
MPKTLGVMQPYFLPYIGYFQLICAVDEFVIYDNIEFTKRGWINRNQMLLDGHSATFSIPVKNDSDFLDIRERKLARDCGRQKRKILNQMREAYRRAPYFDTVYPLVELCLMHKQEDLFLFIRHSLDQVCKHLTVSTPFVVSSSIAMNHSLRGQDRVLETCRQRSADHYINPIGGKALYEREAFASRGIGLSFLKARATKYEQFGNNFIPSLSIIDVMMFNERSRVRELLEAYDLV